MVSESAGRVQFGVIEKLTSACYFKIARETMLYMLVVCYISVIYLRELLYHNEIMVQARCDKHDNF